MPLPPTKPQWQPEVNRFADFDVDARIEQADETTGEDQTVDWVTLDEIARFGDDLRRFTGKILIRLAQQAEAFVDQRHTGRQQGIHMLEVRLVRCRRR